MSTLERLFESILLSFIITGLAALGWNQLGAADALSLPHVGFWAIMGGLTVLNVIAYEIGGGLRAGRNRVDEVSDR